MANLGDMVVKIVGDTTGFNNSVDGTGKKMLAFGINAAAMVAAAAAVGKAILDDIKALVEYGSAVYDASEKTGLSTDAIQEWKFIAEQSGTTIENVTGAVGLMTRGLTTNAEAFRQIGVETQNADGSFRSTTQIFNDTIAALSSMTDETARDQLAFKLLGRSAQSLIPILNAGSQGVSDMREQAHKLGIVLGEETIKDCDNLGDSTDALKASWKAFTMSLVADSLPALTSTTNAVSELLSKVSESSNMSRNITEVLIGKKDDIESVRKAMMDIQTLISESKNVFRVGPATEQSTKGTKELVAEYERLKRLHDQLIPQEQARIAAAEIQAQKDKERAASAAYLMKIEGEAAALREYYFNKEAETNGARYDAAYKAYQLAEARKNIVVEESPAVAELANQYIQFGIAMQTAGDDTSTTTEEIKKQNQAVELLKTNISTGLVNSFVSLGEAMRQGEDPAKALFKSLINMIGDTIIAFAGLVEAQGWATFPFVDWVKVIEGGVLAVAGGAVKATAAMMAEGGVVMPSPGGTPAILAEAGKAEAVIPLDKLDKMLETRGGSSGGGGMTQLIVNLDSRPLLDKIFDATKNRTVLISQGAVV